MIDLNVGELGHVVIVGRHTVLYMAEVCGNHFRIIKLCYFSYGYYLQVRKIRHAAMHSP